eukprot:121112-Prymnesium_polylepis.1
MAGEEALLVMDSDGSPDHWDSMEFLTSKEVWESKLFNPHGEPPPPETQALKWDSRPAKRPGVKRVLLDVLYTGNVDRHTKLAPNANVTGHGSVRAIA